MTIEDYIDRRNDLQLIAENRNEAEAKRIWTELGVANRHIARVIDNALPLESVEKEIQNCLERVSGLLIARRRIDL